MSHVSGTDRKERKEITKREISELEDLIVLDGPDGTWDAGCIIELVEEIRRLRGWSEFHWPENFDKIFSTSTNADIVHFDFSEILKRRD